MIISQKTIEKLRILINEETEYRSGPALVAFFNQYGFKDVYGKSFPSRWIYTEEKIRALNGSPELRNHIQPFQQLLEYFSPDENTAKFAFKY